MTTRQFLRTVAIAAWMAFAAFMIWLWQIKAAPLEAALLGALIAVASIVLALIPSTAGTRDPTFELFFSEARSFHPAFYALVLASWVAECLPSEMKGFPTEVAMLLTGTALIYVVWQMFFGKYPGAFGASYGAAFSVWLFGGFVVLGPYVFLPRLRSPVTTDAT